MEPSQNPYEAPQLPLAQVAPPSPAALRPGELPCHACGEPVLPGSVKCPRCGVGPRFDSLQLLVTALLVMAAALSVFLWAHFRKQEFNEPTNLMILGVCIAVIMPAINWLFKKLKGGKW
jgi:hypothetical protein